MIVDFSYPVFQSKQDHHIRHYKDIQLVQNGPWMQEINHAQI